MSLLENSTAAERAAGCVWAETFKDAAAVVRNGGSISKYLSDFLKNI